ncbi:MAG: hypothetical protein B6D68_02325 [spirochete symbiont of Stewartia floridana]|nr:MAG: hypothetical protein B6D68_02325 [spirochete symbiont of Stewartia floridana]
MDEVDLLPVRMLNEYAYCPRLFHLMYVQGRWADNAYTVEGRNVHRRVDEKDMLLPDVDADGEDAPPKISRSVPLSSERLKLTGKLDLVELSGRDARPVESKRGKVPNNAQRCWEPERVQLMAQGLLLREHGYACNDGVLYFAGSKTRVDVSFDEGLEARTMQLIEEAVALSTCKACPPPLDDSPKCGGCSLAGICMPDEIRSLAEDGAAVPDVRRLFAAREDAVPLYVQEQGARVGKKGLNLSVRKKEEVLAEVNLKDVSQLVLLGNISVSAQAVNWLCQECVPIVHCTMGHWFCGITAGISIRNGYARAAQYRVAESQEQCLEIARVIVETKAANQRTFLRRNAPKTVSKTLTKMAALIKRVADAPSLEYLLGLEGNAAALYFGAFSELLNPRSFNSDWEFTKRNRRPPRDPVNALLSFGYAMLSKECLTALLAEGLDPWWGFYHRPRHGRPALALDLMEEFRPLVVDSAVVKAINTGMVASNGFQFADAGCILTDKGRKAFIHAYESRLDQLIIHPIFDYHCSWRTVIRLQARLMAKWIAGDTDRYVGITTR